MNCWATTSLELDSKMTASPLETLFFLTISKPIRCYEKFTCEELPGFGCTSDVLFDDSFEDCYPFCCFLAELKCICLIELLFCLIPGEMNLVKTSFLRLGDWIFFTVFAVLATLDVALEGG